MTLKKKKNNTKPTTKQPVLAPYRYYCQRCSELFLPRHLLYFVHADHKYETCSLLASVPAPDITWFVGLGGNMGSLPSEHLLCFHLLRVTAGGSTTEELSRSAGT